MRNTLAETGRRGVRLLPSDGCGLCFVAALSAGAERLRGGPRCVPARRTGAAACVLAMILPVAFAVREPFGAAATLAVATPANGLLFLHLGHCEAALPAAFFVAYVCGRIAPSPTAVARPRGGPDRCCAAMRQRTVAGLVPDPPHGSHTLMRFPDGPSIRGEARQNIPALSDAESVTLRPGCRDDAAAMRDLAKAAYEPYVARMGRFPVPMTVDYASIAGSGKAWAGEQRERLIRLLVLDPSADHLPPDNVAVDPNAQGVGVGSRPFAVRRGASRGSGA